MSLNIGVIGAGHLGKYHLEKLKNRDDINLIGFFDQEKSQRKFIVNELGVNAFNQIDELLKQCDAVTIATPTINHYYPILSFQD